MDWVVAVREPLVTRSLMHPGIGDNWFAAEVVMSEIVKT
jgi:hypothetical protein